MVHHKPWNLYTLAKAAVLPASHLCCLFSAQSKGCTAEPNITTANSWWHILWEHPFLPGAKNGKMCHLGGATVPTNIFTPLWKAIALKYLQKHTTTVHFSMPWTEKLKPNKSFHMHAVHIQLLLLFSDSQRTASRDCRWQFLLGVCHAGVWWQCAMLQGST